MQALPIQMFIRLVTVKQHAPMVGLVTVERFPTKLIITSHTRMEKYQGGAQHKKYLVGRARSDLNACPVHDAAN
jgi:hypothetical protein